MGDAARCGDGLDVVALLDRFESVPQAHAAAEQDRHLHDVERGFADEECEVWGSDGRLLAQSRQLVLLAR